MKILLKPQLKADLMLVIITVFWGISSFLTKIALNGLQEFTLISLRMVIAFGLSVLFLWKRFKIDRKLLLYSSILGTLNFFIFASMTFGVRHTTVSNAGFLTCLAAIFVPLISFFVFRQKLGAKTIICSVLAALGVYLLTMGGGQLYFNIGDLLCILCSILFAVFIILTDIFIRNCDPLTLSVIQLGFVAVYSIVCAFIFETPKLPPDGVSWLAVLILAIFCTAIGSLIQTLAQKNTSPSHTALILSLEPVFAAFAGYFFLGEILSVAGYTGAVIMLASIILMETDVAGLSEAIKKRFQGQEPK